MWGVLGMELPESSIKMRIFPQSWQQQQGLSLGLCPSMSLRCRPMILLELLQTALWNYKPLSEEPQLMLWLVPEGMQQEQSVRSSPLPSLLQGTASCCGSWRRESSPRGTHFTSAWTSTSPASWTAAPCPWNVMRLSTFSTPCTRAGVSGCVPGWIPTLTGTWRWGPFPATVGESDTEWPSLRAGIYKLNYSCEERCVLNSDDVKL